MADQLGATLDGLESKVNERTVDLEDAKLQAESAPPNKGDFLAPMNNEIHAASERPSSADSAVTPMGARASLAPYSRCA
jgi:hypothetical protein